MNRLELEKTKARVSMNDLINEKLEQRKEFERLLAESVNEKSKGTFKYDLSNSLEP